LKQQTTLLVLEDGLIFRGYNFGAVGETCGEVVFNTSITGYQEILTDPSYTGQIVVMTYPEIGNYGVNYEDSESHRPFAAGFVVHEYSEVVSNWRARCSLGEFLADHQIVGIAGIDTRKLVRHLRERGAMRGIISTKERNVEALLRQVKASPSMLGRALAAEVSCTDPYEWNDNRPQATAVRPHIVAYDFGIKYSILRSLTQSGFRVTVVPYNTSADEVIRMSPDGIFLSNGPGDPESLVSIKNDILRLAERYPTFGICLGHQLLGLSFGGKTYKLKFGHRGGNHPVKNLLTGCVEITAHNHGFTIDIDSLPDELQLTHINLNDQTVEGMRHRHLPIFSVQYHPEASPGPHDGSHLFDEFYEVVRKRTREEFFTTEYTEYTEVSL
jgi:carbamoyl-phosphate synthase small subunit